MSDTHEVLIHLRPTASRPCPWLTHDRAFGTSVVSIAHEAPNHNGPLTIVGVRLDGIEQVHRVVDSYTVIVSPRIPEQGGRLTILCKAPYSSKVDRKALAPGTPRQDDSYGLQRAVNRFSGQRG